MTQIHCDAYKKLKMLVIIVTINIIVLAGNMCAEFNKLNWVEVAKNTTGLQIMFDFAEPIYVRKKLDIKNQQLHLTFPGMNLKQFNSKHLLTHLNKLTTSGLISQLNIREKTKPIPRVTVVFSFAQPAIIEENIQKNSDITPTNRLLIKWSKMEDPNRFIIDIFKLDALDVLHKQNDIIMQAHHKAHPNTHHKKKIRIILDPGHGGNESGSVGINKLKEKDLVLSVARKACDLLKKDNYSVFLTRSDDSQLSLLERSEFADQLKADLFVSIHANAAPRSSDQEAFGIETLFLNDQQTHPSNEQRGFFFLNAKQAPHYLTTLDNQTKKHIDLSQKLAKSLQTNLLQCLANENFATKDRGIKKRHCRVLLRNRIPSALVEVGFLTHKKEAKNLASLHYQKVLAEGIRKGIHHFVAAYKRGINP